MMSDLERLLHVFGDLTETSISKGFKYVHEKYEWVDSNEEALELMSRFRGTLVASLCGQVEELLGRKFASFIDQLSSRPTTKKDKFWHRDMPKGSSLKGRAEIMWAVRIAYTHGNGRLSQISDESVKDYLKNSRTHFRGVDVKTDKIILYGDVTYPAIRTIVDIYEKFK